MSSDNRQKRNKPPETSYENAGDWRSFRDAAVNPLLQAALGCFVEHGYHGTTIRVLAASAGLSVPGLYHHYASKQAILVGIMERAMTDLFDRSTAALSEGTTTEDRFRLLVECLVLFHAHHGDLAFVAASEIRGLAPAARAKHIAARDTQQRLLDDLVVEGVESGIFVSESPREASRAITTMCTGVAQWYRLGGELSPEELADRYVVLSLRALGRSAADR